jgi:hypothetical protein
MDLENSGHLHMDGKRKGKDPRGESFVTNIHLYRETVITNIERRVVYPGEDGRAD